MCAWSPDAPLQKPNVPEKRKPEAVDRADRSPAAQETQEMSDAEIDRRVAQAAAHLRDIHQAREIKRDLGVDPFAAKTEVRKGEQEDWTNLVIARMRHPETKLKFLASKADILMGVAPYAQTNALQKEQETKRYHYDQIRTYDARVDDAALRTVGKEWGQVPFPSSP